MQADELEEKNNGSTNSDDSRSVNTDVDSTVSSSVSLSENHVKFCCVCQKPSSGAHCCSICKRLVHVICGISESGAEGYGSNVLCKLCYQHKNAHEIRESCKRSLEEQGNEMLNRSRKKFAPVEVGTNVTVPVSYLDRGPTDSRNIVAVVMSEKEGFYQLGTEHAVLPRLYSRNQFEPCKEKFFGIDKVPKYKELGVRKQVAAVSGNSQGFIRCGCKKKCEEGSRCKCRQNKTLCNSRCHDSLSCCNK